MKALILTLSLLLMVALFVGGLLHYLNTDPEGESDEHE